MSVADYIGCCITICRESRLGLTLGILDNLGETWTIRILELLYYGINRIVFYGYTEIEMDVLGYITIVTLDIRPHLVVHEPGNLLCCYSVKSILSYDKIRCLIYSIRDILESEYPESPEYTKCRDNNCIEPTWHTDI
jgi:hypothetical protein